MLWPEAQDPFANKNQELDMLAWRTRPCYAPSSAEVNTFVEPGAWSSWKHLNKQYDRIRQGFLVTELTEWVCSPINPTGSCKRESTLLSPTRLAVSASIVYKLESRSRRQQMYWEVNEGKPFLLPLSLYWPPAVGMARLKGCGTSPYLLSQTGLGTQEICLHMSPEIKGIYDLAWA